MRALAALTTLIAAGSLAACGSQQAADRSATTAAAAALSSTISMSGVELAALRDGAAMSTRTRETFWGGNPKKDQQHEIDDRGFDLDGARLVARQGPVSVYAAMRRDDVVTRGERMVCAIVARPARGDLPASASTPCAPIEHFNRRGIVTSKGNPGDRIVAGVVPDSVTHATVAYEDGTHEQLELQGNGFILQTKRSPTVLTTNGIRGAVKVDVTMPE